MAFFVESLKGEEPSQFDTTMSQFMECAHACRQAKLDERAAAEEERSSQLTQLAQSKNELENWVESLTSELNALESDDKAKPETSPPMPQENDLKSIHWHMQRARILSAERHAKEDEEAMQHGHKHGEQITSLRPSI